MSAVMAEHADRLGSERPAPGRAVRSNGCVHMILFNRHSVLSPREGGTEMRCLVKRTLLCCPKDKLSKL